jgi:hypothetical protein
MTWTQILDIVATLGVLALMARFFMEIMTRRRAKQRLRSDAGAEKPSTLASADHDSTVN